MNLDDTRNRIFVRKCALHGCVESVQAIPLLVFATLRFRTRLLRDRLKAQS
jgi:hypothetical protein